MSKSVSPWVTETLCTGPGLRVPMSRRKAAQRQSPSGRVGESASGSLQRWELKDRICFYKIWTQICFIRRDEDFGPTCPSLHHLGDLKRPAEGGHHDLIEAPRGQRGQQVMMHVAAQHGGRENPGVVKEQSHLETGEMTTGLNSTLNR